jgi:uncharacterized phage-associated protein
VYNTRRNLYTCSGKGEKTEAVVVYFPLKVNKAVQAIGVLFRADGVRRMSYMRVLKLLYIADREALGETGRPITGGRAVAMERGPVLEEVYSLIRGQHPDMPLWDRHFRKDRYSLAMAEDPDVRQLSKYEIRKLQQVAEKYAEFDEWDLSAITHGFPEWQKNDPGKSSAPIPLSDMLEAVIGEGPDAQKIIDEACEKARIERLFGR